MSNNIDVQPEITAAEEEVRRAREALENDLEAISQSGKRAISRAVQTTRPLVVGACVVGGFVAVAGITKLLRPKPRPIFSFAARPSLLSIAARAALSTLVRTVAVRVAQRISVQIGEAALRLPNPRPEPESAYAAPSDSIAGADRAV